MGKGTSDPTPQSPLSYSRQVKTLKLVHVASASVVQTLLCHGTPSSDFKNKPRPDGPLTFGLDKKVSVTYTGSDYAPFTKLDEVDPYAAYNTVSKPIEAEFATLSSSSSGPTTTTSTTPTTSIPQHTTPTQSGVASPTSSTAGANSSDGEGSVPKKGGLSTGAIARIGVGAAVLVIAIVVLAFFFFWRRRKARLAAAAVAANNAPGGKEEHKKGAGYYKAKLENNPKPHGNELDGSNAAEIKKSHELGLGTRRYELGDGGEGGLGGGWNFHDHVV